MNTAVTLFGERRRSPRTHAYFPVEVHHDDGEPVTAMTRDVSRHGAQLMTTRALVPNTQLAVLMYPTEPESSHTATGRVVRVSERTDGGLWRWVVCVKFDAPVDSIEGEAATTAARQRVIGW